MPNPSSFSGCLLSEAWPGILNGLGFRAEFAGLAVQVY